MAVIRIVRNEAANCITFEGTSVPAYFNACLSGEISSLDPDKINIRNDIRSNNQGEDFYEFSNIHYLDFEDRDGNTFSSAQECVDYITSQGNVLGLNSVGKDLTGTTVNFRLDQTSTSIIMDNGEAFGVNTIKAVPDGGLIKIKSIGEGIPTGSEEPADRVHFENLEHTKVEINGALVTGGIEDVVNKLNELFTVGAFEAVVISDPYSTMVADVNGVDADYTLEGNTAIDPVGDDIFTNSSSGNYAGLKSVSTINQAGEYFTFDIRGEGQIGFGLVHTQASYDDGYFSGNSNYADPTSFAVSNSAHYGFQFSHWFHPTPNGSWTNYGANTSYAQGEAWYNSNVHFEGRDEWLAGDPIKIKVGIDENGFIAISSLADDAVTWKLHVRTTYPVSQGSEFHLGIKAANSSPRVFTAPKVHLLEPAAPTMYFRYIESPDGNFHYPLFATEEEANYYDTINGGAGESSIIVYPDDPTFSNWYRPTNGFTNSSASAPNGTETFGGNLISWTEITSLTNVDLVPPAFTDTTVVVDELSAVNYQLSPVDVGYVTTIGGIPAWTVLGGTTLVGTAPEVTGDYNANPFDETTVTVYRTNSYGTSQGTLTIRITNLTAPAVAISGFTLVGGTTALVDADTLGDGSVVTMDDTIADGERFVIDKAYVVDNILPSLQAAGDTYIIGLQNSGSDFSTLELSDFDAAIVWDYASSGSHRVRFMRDGVAQLTYTVNSLTQSFYDYAVEVNGTSAWLIGCNINAINNEPSPADGGQFTHTYEATSIEDTAPVTIHMAALNTTGDISTTDLTTLTTPAAPTGNLTNWSKALDFSGSNEYAVQVSTNNVVNPLMMGGLSVTTAAPATSSNTSNDINARPWATAVVFSTDNISSNQHIWNLGEGAGSTDDNIYLRVSSSGDLYFGWGRQGASNEYLIGRNIGTNWYGVYIGYNGTRLSGANATTTNLSDAFDIKRMFYSGGSWIFDPNPTYNGIGQWITTGGRMDREFTGSFTIGGRGANRNFHGKVASMVVTTLRRNVAMPTNTEVEMMITDPVKWINDYKEGNQFRYPATTQESTFTKGSTLGFAGTQVWLMGDGISDSYANGIRNEVLKSDQNWTKLQLISMVSNDIQNVTINGLS